MAVSIADLAFNSTTGLAVITLTTPAFTITSNANRAGLLGLSVNPNTPTSITGSMGGVSGTLITGTDTGSAITNLRSMQFQVIAPPSGSQTATMSWTTAVSAVLGAVATSGVDQTTPFNNGTFSTASTTGPSSVTITSTNGDLTCDTSGDDGASVPSSPSQTQLWVSGTNNNAMGSRGPGTGTSTHSWTLSVDTAGWTASGSNFKQVASVPDSIGPANIVSSVGRYIGWTV